MYALKDATKGRNSAYFCEEGFMTFDTEKQKGSKFQEELSLLNAQIELEYQMCLSSEQMEMLELFDAAERHGTDYGKGFQDGFLASRVLCQKYKTW